MWQAVRQKQTEGRYIWQTCTVRSSRTAGKHTDGRQTHRWKADTTIAAGRHKDDRQTHRQKADTPTEGRHTEQ
jgi:hypothetical protein